MHAVWLASESCSSRIGLLWTSFPSPTSQLLLKSLLPLELLGQRELPPFLKDGSLSDLCVQE